MTDTSLHPPIASHSQPGWLARIEAWLDARGKCAWIAAMILGFVFVWPVGLAILAYMIWSKRMFACNKSNHRRRHNSHEAWSEMRHTWRSTMKPSGNRAFDAYKAETLRRLEEEQRSFETFLERLREAKDKSEFDQFMDERASDTGFDADADVDADVDAEPFAEEPKAARKSGKS